MAALVFETSQTWCCVVGWAWRLQGYMTCLAPCMHCCCHSRVWPTSCPFGCKGFMCHITRVCQRKNTKVHIVVVYRVCINSAAWLHSIS